MQPKYIGMVHSIGWLNSRHLVRLTARTLTPDPLTAVAAGGAYHRVKALIFLFLFFCVTFKKIQKDMQRTKKSVRGARLCIAHKKRILWRLTAFYCPWRFTGEHIT